MIVTDQKHTERRLLNLGMYHTAIFAYLYTLITTQDFQIEKQFIP